MLAATGGGDMVGWFAAKLLGASVAGDAVKFVAGIGANPAPPGGGVPVGEKGGGVRGGVSLRALLKVAVTTTPIAQRPSNEYTSKLIIGIM